MQYLTLTNLKNLLYHNNLFYPGVVSTSATPVVNGPCKADFIDSTIGLPEALASRRSNGSPFMAHGRSGVALYGSNMGLGGTGVGSDWTQPFGASVGLGSCHEVSVHGPTNIGLQPYFVVGKYDFDRTRNTSALGKSNNIASLHGVVKSLLIL